MDKLNTHSYDGKIKYEEPRVEYDKEIFNQFLSRLKDGNAIRMANCILSKNGNLDRSNNIDAMNILMWIISRELNDDVFAVLEEQLSDAMTKGPCPEGRTTRLFQVYNIIKNE